MAKMGIQCIVFMLKSQRGSCSVSLAVLHYKKNADQEWRSCWQLRKIKTNHAHCDFLLFLKIVHKEQLYKAAV